uniref:Uncharacterized protein n=1 Tax=Heterorhabditis bacteriophora TaxID=37862 RepID=A0A1I7XTS2_HETBA
MFTSRPVKEIQLHNDNGVVVKGLIQMYIDTNVSGKRLLCAINGKLNRAKERNRESMLLMIEEDLTQTLLNSQEAETFEKSAVAVNANQLWKSRNGLSQSVGVSKKMDSKNSARSFTVQYSSNTCSISMVYYLRQVDKLDDKKKSQIRPQTNTSPLTSVLSLLILRSQAWRLNIRDEVVTKSKVLYITYFALKVHIIIRGGGIHMTIDKEVDMPI